MPKKKSTSSKGPKKSHVAKAKQIKKMIQAAEAHQPVQVRTYQQKHKPKVDQDGRGSDGTSLMLNEKRRVRLPLAQVYPRPALNCSIDRSKPKPPTTQSQALTSFPELGLDDVTLVFKDERHNHKGFLPIPVVNIPYASSPKEPFRFLDLPNEIQDMIFESMIPSDHFHIFWVNQNRRTKTLTHSRPRGRPNLLHDVLSRRAFQQRQLNSDRTSMLLHVYRSRSPIAPLWVNRHFYIRASRVFYHKATFIFSNLGPLRHFLDTVSAANKETIRSLKLVHTPYGHPWQTSNGIWKSVYDRAWSNLCYRISTELPNIRSLNLEMRMHSLPLGFQPLDLDQLCYSQDFSIKWLVPLCLFKKYRLERCYVRIMSRVKDETVLEVESWQLRRELMGDRWDDRKEAKRSAYGFNIHAKSHPQEQRLGLCGC